MKCLEPAFYQPHITGITPADFYNNNLCAAAVAGLLLIALVAWSNYIAGKYFQLFSGRIAAYFRSKKIVDVLLAAAGWIVTAFERIFAVAFQQPGFEFIVELKSQYLHKSLAVFLPGHRKEYLDAPIQIAGHKVGTGKIEFFAAAIGKIVYAAVFQIAVNNAYNIDVVIAHTRLQTANAPHDQIYFHPGISCRVKFADDLRIGQTVHLGDDPAGALRGGFFHFPLDEGRKFPPQIKGGGGDLCPVDVGAGVAGYDVE